MITNNINTENLNQSEMYNISITVSTNHKSEDFVIFYAKLENPEETYR